MPCAMYSAVRTAKRERERRAESSTAVGSVLWLRDLATDEADHDEAETSEGEDLVDPIRKIQSHSGVVDRIEVRDEAHGDAKVHDELEKAAHVCYAVLA